MRELQCKRIYDAPSPSDGFRVLVDRLWPRGVRREVAALDLWAKELAPSAELRRWFGHAPERFEAFSALYTAQLDATPAAAELLRIIREEGERRRVTLLYAARDAACNHAVVLKAWIERRLA